jgi:TRAP-type C4-dicarboxylate transport system substrate-binding protein
MEMNKIKTTIIAGAIAAMAITGATYGANAATVLKLASFVPPVYILHKPIFEKLASDLDAATGGSVKIEIYPSGDLEAVPELTNP